MASIKQERLRELKERRDRYIYIEKAILEGKPQSYTIGPKSKTNYSMSLADVRKAIKELDTEIAELEAEISGGARRVYAVIPRDF